MKYFVVDAFSDVLFGGNPAGICLLEQPLETAVMQNIAFENNLSETAFVIKRDGYYDLKWFTPEVEIDLCGHATLGSAFVLMNFVDTAMQTVDFQTLSGKLTVRRYGEIFILDFPSRKPVPCAIPALLDEVLGVKVLETHISRDLLVIVENEYAVRTMRPDMTKLVNYKDINAVIVTSAGEDCDFVSRFFAPKMGINEDPVTGSSHTTLIPFWRQRLGKTEMLARQLSKRGGTLFCRDCGGRVEIGGTAALYLSGEIIL